MQTLRIGLDFDGVIAASMEQHAEAYRQALAPLGVEVSDEDVFCREGARSETIIRDLTPGLQVDAASLADEKQRLFRALGPVSMYPGAVALVRSLQETLPVALVTGTRRANLEALIPDLLPGFGAVMSQEYYTHDKPHPEPYQRAAEALGIEASQLICVENAMRGVQSAKAAGYGAVVGITTTQTPEMLHEADHIIHDHAALGTILAELLQRI